jgi:hypothetical protein
MECEIVNKWQLSFPRMVLLSYCQMLSHNVCDQSRWSIGFCAGLPWCRSPTLVLCSALPHPPHDPLTATSSPLFIDLFVCVSALRVTATMICFLFRISQWLQLEWYGAVSYRTFFRWTIHTIYFWNKLETKVQHNINENVLLNICSCWIPIRTSSVCWYTWYVNVCKS